jgi:hypothetical protein
MCACVCVCACVRACARVCVCVCVCSNNTRTHSFDSMITLKVPVRPVELIKDLNLNSNVLRLH